jgi:hypothetical protein
VNDDENSWWDESDCGSVYQGDSSAHMFLLESIDPIPSR